MIQLQSCYKLSIGKPEKKRETLRDTIYNLLIMLEKIPHK